MASVFDYMVVGAGLFGSVFAREMAEAGQKVLIIEKRNHIGGNVYTRDEHGVQVHVYGPHLFHTNNRDIWNYVNRFTDFNHYQHKVKAFHDGKIYSLPFNMMTYYQLWGCTTPAEAEVELEKQREIIPNPNNLEEWALCQVGRDIYDKLIYGYTKKQWQREPRDLPASIIKRLPLRMTWDENYFHDQFQGVPTKGFTHMVENILDHPNIKVKLNTEFDNHCGSWVCHAHKLIYSGAIDEYYDYQYGPLEYRSLRFESKVHDGNFQGCGQMNYTEGDVPWTRSIEHQHFALELYKKSVVTLEYPQEWKPGKPRYYPISDKKNMTLYGKYKALAKKEDQVIFGGRLGTYNYLDMHQVIGQALAIAKQELHVFH